MNKRNGKTRSAGPGVMNMKESGQDFKFGKKTQISMGK